MSYQDYYNTDGWDPEFRRMMDLVNELGEENFGPRAAEVDRDARFPTENYEDFAEHGFLRLVIPKEYGGFGFSLCQYAMIGAEIGKYCGATALTFNMHTSSVMWSRFMYEMPHLTEEDRAKFAPLRERQFRNVVEDHAIYSQPISEGGTNWTSKPIQTNCKRVDGGWVINGFKKFA